MKKLGVFLLLGVSLTAFGKKEVDNCSDHVANRVDERTMPFPILVDGDPLLQKAAAPIPEDLLGTPHFDGFLNRLAITRAHSGDPMITAPQVGKTVRIIVVREMVMINPELTVLDDSLRDSYESSISSPGVRLKIRRAKHVKISFLDRRGNPREREAEGEMAFTYQRAMDHLNGILIDDRFLN